MGHATARAKNRMRLKIDMLLTDRFTAIVSPLISRKSIFHLRYQAAPTHGASATRVGSHWRLFK
jgi:hypothetical protein